MAASRIPRLDLGEAAAVMPNQTFETTVYSGLQSGSSLTTLCI